MIYKRFGRWSKNSGRTSRVSVFYAGTNGSGTSTLREADDDTLIAVHIDSDAIARQINPAKPRTVDLTAGRQALAQFQSALTAGTSFIGDGRSNACKLRAQLD